MTINGYANNSPASGAPAIIGTARVGQLLAASTGGIMDTDGLTGATFQYQWVRDDGDNETNIAGATSLAYRVTPEDEGATLKVKVSFTDDSGFDEEVTSDPTATIAAATTSDSTAPVVRYWVPTHLYVGVVIRLHSSTDVDIASYAALGLPAGLTINATNGQIRGQPTMVSTAPATVVVTVTDASDNVTNIQLIFPPVEATTDTTAPRVVSIERQNPDTSPTNADSLTWRVVFSESVDLNTTLGDIGNAFYRELFTVSGSTAMVTNVEAVSGYVGISNCMVCDVTVTGGNLVGLDGTVILGFASGHGIIQHAFPPISLTNTTPIEADESYVVDNTAPSVSYTVPTALAVDTAITPITPTTTDPDASGHSYSATGLPAGLGIDPSTGVISGSPTTVGTASDVVVVVMDSAGNSVTITLAFPAVVTNAAPTVANAIADRTITVGTALNFAFPSTTFTDADSDLLTYSATLDDGTPLPSWLMFDATNRSFSGIPGAGDGGAITVRVTASDGVATGHDDFRIRVGTTCPAPSLGSRRQLWSGTMTVGTWGGNGAVVFSHGYLDTSLISDPTDIGAIDDNDFAIAGRTYIIDRVDVWREDTLAGNLRFSLTSSLTSQEKAALRLHVCDTAYDFDDASDPSIPSRNYYDWFLGLDWSGESTRTLYLSLPANNAASGLPTITSSDGATVGDVLTANQATIADTDGLPDTFPNDYTFQWLREDENGSNQQPIPGQTSQTYTLSNDDVGKKVRVQVSFTDRLSGMETVTSDAFPASGTVTPPLVTVTGPSSAVEEGAALTFTLTLDQPAATDLSVNVAISETGDVVAGADEGSQTVSIAAGDTQATLTVATDDDDDDEANSEVTVAVVADSASPVTYGAGSPSAVMVTVEDNDLPRLRLDGPSQATYDEGETVRFGLTREGDLSSQLVVPVTVSGGEAMIAATPPSNVTFGVGSDTATLSISTEDDDVDEENSDISVTVSANAAVYRLVDTTDNPVDEQMANATIQDNDTRGVRVSGSPLVVNEGGTGAYRVELESAPTGDVTITLSPPDNEDVSVSPTTLTFTALNWNTPQPVSVTTTEDTDDVDDTATITHTVAGADYGDNNVTAESVMVTVSEMALPIITIVAGTSPISEGTDAAFTLTRDDTTNELTVNLTVTQDGDMLPATALSPGAVIFNAGSSTAPFSVATDDDDVDEGEGTVMVAVAPDRASPASYVLGTPATASVTVEDNDASPVVTLLLSESAIAEAGGVSEVRATLNNPSAEDTQVTVTIPDTVTGAVLLGGDPVLLIPAGATASDNAVTLMAVDNPVEASEDLQVTVSGMAENTLGVTQPEPVPLTILDDDDNTAPTVSITNVPPTSSAPFTATITFSEAVNGFMVGDIMAANANLSDFTEATTEGATTGEATTGEATPGIIYTVLVTPTADGAVTLNIAANVATDAAGNGNTASPQATSTYTAPHVTSIERQAPTTSPTNADRLTWRVTFSEVVTNVDAADFTVSGTTATLSVAPVTGQPAAWDVTISGGDLATLNSTVRLDLASGHNIVGSGGGALATTPPTGTNDNVYVVDHTAPTVDYPAPTSLVVGMAIDPITPITPTTEDTDIARWSATGLPAGLVIDELTGVISGTPTTVSAAPSQVSVTVTDRSGNSTTVRLNFPAVAQETAQATRTAQQEAEVVLKEVVLPNLVQQLTAETTEVITSRLNTIASGSPLGTPPSLSLEDVVADTVAFFHGEREHLKNGSLEWRQVLSGREFVWPLSSLDVAQGESADAQEEHPFSTLAIWGGGNYSSYRNIIENTDVDGNGFSAAIGMDLQPTHQLTTGLVLTTSRWGLDYATDANDANDASDVNDASAEGTYGIGITMVHPYVSWSATEQLSLWATVGYGRGEVEQTPDGEDPATSTDSLISWAGGVRFEVVPGMDPLTGQGAPFGLAFKADGATSSFLETSVQLARLAAEVSHAFAVENGLLTAALDLGWSIRSVADQDDRDGQQQAIAEKNHGGGAELAGNLNWRNTDGRFSATLDTRVLLGGGHHREWGIGGHLRLTPSRRNGEGLSLTLQPSFGITGTRLAELWSLSGDGDLAINNNQPGARLDAELAYGFPLSDALLTPYTELAWEEAASIYGAGLRYGLSPSLELDLKGTRRSNTHGDTEHRFSLDVRSGL